MDEKVDPKDLVASDADVQDQICQKCGALVIEQFNPETKTTDKICNCGSEAEMAAKIAAAREVRNVQGKPAEAVVEPIPAQEPAPSAADVAPQDSAPMFNVKDALMSLPGAPSQEQIDAWKRDFGSIYMFPFDTREIYVWRPIRRREWEMLQTNEKLVQQENKFQEQIVMRTVLWPKIGPVELNMSRAGLVQTLFSVIMQGSYFLHPDFAVTLVQEL